ncbi:MAG: class I SAM-dependent RNA methyltransferase [Myxococcales bacterium]|nr:class I SAM-dependent RNA methyltransferase [Myxococcales bacterium]
MIRGERLSLTITGLAFGGDAVGRAPDGRVVFVAGGVPGDQLRIEVDEAKRDFARASLLEVLSPGASRVAARCPLSGSCGGCQWQEVALAVQRAAKQAVVIRALGRLGCTIDPLCAPSDGFGYRTRARLTVGDGAIGFQARRSHRVIDVTTCPLLHPALDAALAEARRAAFGQMDPGGTIAGLVGRGDLVHLALEGLRAGAAATARTLIGRAGIVGLVLDAVRFGARDIDTAGASEPPFHAAADGFAQAGDTGNHALRRIVAASAGSSGRTLELYAGDGNFTRDLVAAGHDVLAVEGDPAAIARLRRNVPAATATAEPAERAALRLASQGEKFDLVLIDPPRAGARPLLPSLARLTSRLIYVSCDPMTLARDARDLAAAGLRPIRATALDLMPQTYHVEVVCLFERAG